METEEQKKNTVFNNYMCPFCKKIFSFEIYREDIYDQRFDKMLRVLNNNKEILNHDCTHKLQDHENIIFAKCSDSPEPLEEAFKICRIVDGKRKIYDR